MEYCTHMKFGFPTSGSPSFQRESSRKRSPLTLRSLRYKSDSEKDFPEFETLNCKLQLLSRLLRATIFVHLCGGLRGFGERRRVGVQTFLKTGPQCRLGSGQRFSIRLPFGVTVGVLPR